MVEVAKRTELLLIHELVRYHALQHCVLNSPTSSNHVPSEAYVSVVASKASAALELQGYYLGNKIISRVTLKRGRISDPNRCMVLICKDMWIYLFGKQASRLQSNTHGIYVIQCDQIYWLDNMLMLNKGSLTSGSSEITAEHYKDFYLAFISGIIRGALASLGLTSNVEASSNGQYVFKVSLQI